MSDRNGDCRIGEWIFHARDDELRRPDKRRRLEHRAARTLELLCNHRGEIVSREAIVEAVWSGRQVSPNSVSIVISDLREALEDDARTPRHIETVSKRGYRLLASADAETPAPAERRTANKTVVAACLLAFLGLAILIGLMGPARPPATLLVADVVNATGDPAMDALARASTEVLIGAADTHTSARVMRRHDAKLPEKKGTVLAVDGKLVIWSGMPTLMMSATDPATGRIVWNGKTQGGENAIPPGVTEAMRDLGQRLD